jgi:hypothetical protein
MATRMLLSWELRNPMENRAPRHLGCKIEDAEHLHPVGRYRVFVMDDSDVAKSKGFNQCPNDLVMRDRTVRFGRGGVGTRVSSSRPMVRPLYPISVLVSDILLFPPSGVK